MFFSEETKPLPFTSELDEYQPHLLSLGLVVSHHLLCSGCGVDMLAGVLQVEYLVSTKHLHVFYTTPPCLAKSTPMFLASFHQTFLFFLPKNPSHDLTIVRCSGYGSDWRS